MPRGYTYAGSSSSDMDRTWPEWRKPVTKRYIKPWPITYGQHNLDWDKFQAENAQNAGHELYNFLSAMAVTEPDVHASVAAQLRSLSRTFKATVDPLIVQHMQTINNSVALLNTSIRAKIEHANIRPPRGHTVEHAPVGAVGAAFTAWEQQDGVLDAAMQSHHAVIEAKFGYHTAMTLKKCLSEHMNNGRGRGIYGWVPKDSDVVRLGASVHTFLAMSGKHSCEVHAARAAKGERWMSACECASTIGGAFTFVPNGNGLIMHCSERCLNQECIIINPSSGVPLIPRSRKDPQSERMLELSKALMLQKGVQPPYGRDPIRNLMGSDCWNAYVQAPHQDLLGRRQQLDATSALRYSLLDFPTIKAERAANRVCPSFQWLTNIRDQTVVEAHSHIKAADDLDSALTQSQRNLLREHGVKQLNRLLREHGKMDGIDVSVEDLANMLPGAQQLIDKAILDAMADTQRENIREANVLAAPFTMRILSACILALGSLRRMSESLSGNQPSNFAYSYITGLCAGKDASFSIRELSAQINLDLNESNVSMDEWRKAVTAMHVFDAIDYESITISEMPQEQIEGFMREHNGGAIPSGGLVLKYEFDVGGLRLAGPCVAGTTRQWYEDKMYSASCILVENGFNPQLASVPTMSRFKHIRWDIDSDMGDEHANREAIACFVHWFQWNAQHLCGRPETRAIGLDILTGDSTRSLIKIVGESELDAECVAIAGQQMQMMESAEDKRDEMVE